VGEQSFELSPYDTLYIPTGASFHLRNASADPARVVQCSAPAANVHPPFHSKFDEFSKREERIRYLKGKDVLMMFDVSEAADKRVAGYTFFRAHQRSWPPHNHTDQEEVYFSIKGQGSMEVYTFQMDEFLDWEGRPLPLDHPLSFEGFMRRQVFAKLDPELRPGADHTHFPDPFNPDEITRQIAAVGGVDTCFGGIGYHGHVAFTIHRSRAGTGFPFSSCVNRAREW
jgi:mannose-6-phosphate isomerase-like protein (cupin superfamily)